MKAKADPRALKYAKPPQRSAHWQAKAKAFAAEHGLEVKGVLDLHDHLADIAECIGGHERAAAEFYAWEQTVEILTWTKRAA